MLNLGKFRRDKGCLRQLVRDFLFFKKDVTDLYEKRMIAADMRTVKRKTATGSFIDRGMFLIISRPLRFTLPNCKCLSLNVARLIYIRMLYWNVYAIKGGFSLHTLQPVLRTDV